MMEKRKIKVREIKRGNKILMIFVMRSMEKIFR